MKSYGTPHYIPCFFYISGFLEEEDDVLSKYIKDINVHFANKVVGKYIYALVNTSQSTSVALPGLIANMQTAALIVPNELIKNTCDGEQFLLLH